MVDSVTTNYGWSYPTVGADDSTWGGTLNAAIIAIDAQVHANSVGNAPLASPAFTGTVTMPDSSTVSATGYANIAKLGIGMSATNILDITLNQNSVSQVSILNNSSGSSAEARYIADNGTIKAYFGIFGTGTSSGSIGASTAILLSDASLYIGYASGGVLDFGTSDGSPTRRMRLASDGSLLVGTTTATGAGTISDVSGNVRDMPQNSQGTYTLAATDNGKHILATGNVTVPNSVFSAGKNVAIVNNTGGNITVVQGSGVTMNYNGSSGSRTMAPGIASILFVSASIAILSGATLT